jgi:hypothetical protein
MVESGRLDLKDKFAVLKYKLAGKLMLQSDCCAGWLKKWADSALL